MVPSLIKLGLAAGAAMALGACGTPGDAGMRVPYRMDIVQGNVLTREQAALVKPGMSRLQVRDILGSPMLADLFHGDRWDYVFTIVRGGTAPQQRQVVVHFKGDLLDRIEAAELPSEREFVASISRARPSSRPVPELELAAERIQALPKPRAEVAEPPRPAGSVRSYPPLEPS